MGNTMQYIDSKSVAPGRITRFAIGCQVDDAVVWDISDPCTSKQIQLTNTGDSLIFKARTDSDVISDARIELTTTIREREAYVETINVKLADIIKVC